MVTASTSYIIVNIGVLLAMLMVFRRPFRVTCGILAGLVLCSSSLFHLLFGEGSVVDYPIYSSKWWFDTYEVTVQLTYVFLMIIYSWSHRYLSIIFIINLLYLCGGGLYFVALTVSTDGTIGYNAFGVLLGSLWMVERLTHQTIRTTEEDEETGSSLTWKDRPTFVEAP